MDRFENLITPKRREGFNQRYEIPSGGPRRFLPTVRRGKLVIVDYGRDIKNGRGLTLKQKSDLLKTAFAHRSGIGIGTLAPIGKRKYSKPLIIGFK